MGGFVTPCRYRRGKLNMNCLHLFTAVKVTFGLVTDNSCHFSLVLVGYQSVREVSSTVAAINNPCVSIHRYNFMSYVKLPKLIV